MLQELIHPLKVAGKQTCTRLGIRRLGSIEIPQPVANVDGQLVIFIHFPKNAGTSVNTALGYDTLPHDTLKHRYDALGNRLPDEIPPGNYPIHNTLKETREYVGKARFNRAFKFSIIRNPWDRAISLYNYYIKINNYRMADLPIAFSQWVEWVYGPQKHPYYYARFKKAYTSYHHWLSLDGKSIDVDFVAKLETIDDDWAYICEQIGKTIELPILNRTSGNKHALRHEMFDDRTRALIAKVHAPDIECWGYSFDDPI